MYPKADAILRKNISDITYKHNFLWSYCGNSNMNEQGNQVRILDGTAAVCVESVIRR